MPKTKTSTAKSSTSNKKTSTISKSKFLTTSQKFDVISQRRRRGDAAQIAEKTGYDVSHVYRVLNGSRVNEIIINAAYSHMSRRRVTA